MIKDKFFATSKRVISLINQIPRKNRKRLIYFYFSTAFENQIGESKRYRKYWVYKGNKTKF